MLTILERHDARIAARVWILELDAQNVEMHMHAFSLEFLCAAFHATLDISERGLVLVDSQTHWHNHPLAHSIFTQRFGSNQRYPRLIDLPVFGHSDNHAGLQLADVVCSALLAPIAAAVYAGRYADWNQHCDSGCLDLRDRYGERLERLTFDFVDSRNKMVSSVVVSDPVGTRGTRLLYGPSGARRPSAGRPTDEKLRSTAARGSAAAGR